VLGSGRSVWGIIKMEGVVVVIGGIGWKRGGVLVVIVQWLKIVK